MFKLVVLCALFSLAVAAPAPSGVIAPIAYAAHPSVAVVHAAPALYHAPAVALHAAPSAISTQSNTVIHGAKAAIVSPIAYAAHHQIVAAPLLHAW